MQCREDRAAALGTSVAVALVMRLTIALMLVVLSGPAAAERAASEPEVAAHLHFDTDRARVKSAARETLRRVAPRLATARRVVVVGHADGRGHVLYNQWLALERAVRVRDQLVKLGIDPKRVEVLSEGEHRPHIADEGEVDCSENRRVDLIIVH